jgi:hypothetical protein
MDKEKSNKQTTVKDTDNVSDKEQEEIYINCDRCQGQININSYRTYYTKHGVYCKCCVEKLPADEEDDEEPTNQTEK